MTTPSPRPAADRTRPGGSQRPRADLHFAVVGAYVLDCLVHTSRIPGWGEQHEARSVRTAPGGKALNQAVALARLGAQVSAVGVVGEDGPGQDILSALTREGVGTTAVQARANVSSAVCVCFVGDNGDNSIVWHVDDDVAVTPGTVHGAAAVIRQADAVLITFEMPQESIREAVSITKDSGAMVIVQPAPPLATAPENISLPWHLVDAVVANEAEARALLTGSPGGRQRPASELASALAAELDVPMVVVTLGQAGCVLHCDGISHRYPAEQVVVIDTVGAGDAFVASFAATLAAGAPVEEAVHRAQSAAAWAVRRRGGYEAMPGSDQVACQPADAASPD